MGGGGMIKYRVLYGRYQDTEIEKRIVYRETAKCVFFTCTHSGRKLYKEIKERKQTFDYGWSHQWVDTWKEAHALALQKAKEKEDAMQKAYYKAKSIHVKMKAMKEPS